MFETLYFQVRLFFASEKQRKILRLKKYIEEHPLERKSHAEKTSLEEVQKARMRKAFIAQEKERLKNAYLTSTEMKDMNMCLVLTAPDALCKANKNFNFYSEEKEQFSPKRFPSKTFEDLNHCLVLTMPEHSYKPRRNVSSHFKK